MSEPQMNGIFADYIAEHRPNWNAVPEASAVVEGNRSLRPDLIVKQTPRMPVIVEFEIGAPAVDDAKNRVGITLQGAPHPMTEVLAVGYAKDAKTADRDSFRKRLYADEPFLQVQMVRKTDDGIDVWPPAKPLTSTPRDVLAYIEYMQVPQAVIEEQSEATAERVKSLGDFLHKAVVVSAGARHEVLSSLRRITGCEDDGDAVRTACAIWLVAIDLQDDLAEHSDKMRAKGLLPTGSSLDPDFGVLTASALLQQWQVIRSVNYLPVIDISIESLTACRDVTVVSEVLRELCKLRRGINESQTKHVYNFAGELWQRLVPDRKMRAAFYTKPPVAELLATLAMSRFEDRSIDELAELDIMDAACGTGTLLGAAERALRRLYWDKGGDDAELHRKRMQDHLYAMDVNGISSTLTAKRLTDLEVGQDYDGSRIAAIDDPAGSLLLLDPTVTAVSKVLGYQGVVPEVGPDGREGVFHVPVGGIDLAIMNPPYSRESTAAKPYRAKAKKAGHRMGNAHAGIASDFGDLSDIRLCKDGVLAHVLPMTAANGYGWHEWRKRLEGEYTDVTAIHINDGASADTGIGEMMVVASKCSRESLDESTQIKSVNIDAKVATLAQGYAIAKYVERSSWISADIGSVFVQAQRSRGAPWFGVGTQDLSYTHMVADLRFGQYRPTRQLESEKIAVSMTTLGAIAVTRSSDHTLGHVPGGVSSGSAYSVLPIVDMASDHSFRFLWHVDSKEQTRMLVEPTHAGRVHDERMAIHVESWKSRFFVNAGVRWGNEALCAATTPTEMHGGTMWSSVTDAADDVTMALVLYMNSTIGGILRHAFGNNTQLGRSRLYRRSPLRLIVPNFAADAASAERARAIAVEQWEELIRLELRPFAFAFNDPNRKRIDNVVADMLGMDAASEEIQEMLEHWRVMFCSQRQINGGRKALLAELEAYSRG